MAQGESQKASGDLASLKKVLDLTSKPGGRPDQTLDMNYQKGSIESGGTSGGGSGAGSKADFDYTKGSIERGSK